MVGGYFSDIVYSYMTPILGSLMIVLSYLYFMLTSV